MLRLKNENKYLSILTLAVVAIGCHVVDPHYHYDPPPPSGVQTVTGDGYVEIFWNDLHVDDLAGYKVYRSRQAFGTLGIAETLGEFRYPQDIPHECGHSTSI